MCASCGFNAHGFFRRMHALQSPQDRMQALMASPYSTLSDRTPRMLSAPKEGDFWEADHVRPVEHGGGECDLTNLQTLCTPCHKSKTSKQKTQSGQRKRKAAAEGTPTLQSFFGGGGASS